MMASPGQTVQKDANNFSYLWNMNKQCCHMQYDEVRLILQSLGYQVGQSDDKEDSEFNELLAKIDPHCKGYITYDTLLNFISREPSGEDPDGQLQDSFMLLAKGKDYITPDQLWEAFSPDVADYCIARMALYKGPAVEGALDYSTFDIKIKHPNYSS
ncbi:alpha-actinin, sarcomeric-like [Glandiceps talaboti]